MDKNILDNNIDDKILNESIVVRQLVIHSSDRNADVNKGSIPNSFSFRAYLDGSKGIPQASPSPIKNVKYIKLVDLIIPSINKLVEVGSNWVFSTSSADVMANKLLLLRIEELTDINSLTTGTISSKSIKLKKDKTIGGYDLMIPCNDQPIVFLQSVLPTLSRLTLSIENGFPNPFEEDSDKKILMNEMVTNGSIDDINDLRHPLNIQTQIIVTFDVGIVNNEIATNVKFGP